jgi:adenine-specific DNA glycosylase
LDPVRRLLREKRRDRAAAEVEALDAAWKRLGFKSRTAMIKKAIEAILA